MYVKCLCFIMVDRGLLSEGSGMKYKGQYVSYLFVFLKLSAVTITYHTAGYRTWQSSSFLLLHLLLGLSHVACTNSD